MKDLTGALPASPVLQGGVEGSYIKSTEILTRARSTAVRQNPRLLRRGGFTPCSLHKIISVFTLFNREQYSKSVKC